MGVAHKTNENSGQDPPGKGRRLGKNGIMPELAYPADSSEKVEKRREGRAHEGVKI